MAELHGRRQTPPEITSALDRDGVRPPKRAYRLTPGIVRRLLANLGLRPRVSRGTSAPDLPAGERLLHDLARDLGLSQHTP